MPRDCINSTSALRFTRIEATSGHHDWCRGMVWFRRFYCVLHALRQHRGTMINAEGWYKFNVCIVLYIHWGDTRVPQVMPRDGTNSTFVLWFARIEATSGYHKWCRGMVSTQRLYCVLHALRRHQGTTSDAKGWYQLNVCIVFYMHCGDIRVP